MQFCAVTAAIVVGAVAERGRLIPMMVFVFAWSTLVYCPIAYWVWNPNGWAFKWGVYDYAGGGPVEIGSGMSALAYSWVLGRRQEKMMINFRPHNVSFITLGTVLLWFGWLGFNGGSAYGANLRAVMACWNSNLAAMFSAITWVLLDYRVARKWSMVSWCSGCISGLVAATPASGFIPPWGSIILGIVAGTVCNFATKGVSSALSQVIFANLLQSSFGSKLMTPLTSSRSMRLEELSDSSLMHSSLRHTLLDLMVSTLTKNYSQADGLPTAGSSFTSKWRSS
jgi:Amt family ammonium transporter